MSLVVTDFKSTSGNGLVLSGNKPLPEPKLTDIYDTMYRGKVPDDLGPAKPIPSHINCWVQQKGPHIADDIFKYIFFHKNDYITIQILPMLFLMILLIISHHWFRQWLGATKAPSHCLNHW